MTSRSRSRSRCSDEQRRVSPPAASRAFERSSLLLFIYRCLVFSPLDSAAARERVARSLSSVITALHWSAFPLSRLCCAFLCFLRTSRRAARASSARLAAAAAWRWCGSRPPSQRTPPRPSRATPWFCTQKKVRTPQSDAACTPAETCLQAARFVSRWRRSCVVFLTPPPSSPEARSAARRCRRATGGAAAARRRCRASRCCQRAAAERCCCRRCPPGCRLPSWDACWRRRCWRRRAAELIFTTLLYVTWSCGKRAL